MNLEEWGFNEVWEKYFDENQLTGLEPGRVTTEHKERYVVATAKGEVEAEITGNIRFTAQSREDFPAVGDWVLINLYEPDFAIIQKILPRISVIKRQTVGHVGEVQIIASNVDYAFIVQAADRDFNINRLERYLTICYSSNIEPFILLTKTDLIEETKKIDFMERIQKRVVNVPLIAISNETRAGFDDLESNIRRGKTYCLLGSSGVGKSTLLNNLSGKSLMQTGHISESTQKGKHVTSHRELIVLENGGILIDNPGMREVGITDNVGGLESTFDNIFNLSRNCRYQDCAHTHESGCAIIEAVEKGEIERETYENYLKLVKEKNHFETTVSEKRRREKRLGKIIKDYYKKDIRKKGR